LAIKPIAPDQPEKSVTTQQATALPLVSRPG
jgi:hypothetical protein